MNKLFLLSVPRSGHHAVIQWLCSQESSSMYLNNSSIKDGVTEGQFRKFVDGKSEKVIHKVKYIDKMSEEYPFVLINYVGMDPKEIYNNYGTDSKIAIVVRDIFNTLASMKGRKGGVWSGRVKHIKNWEKYVKLCLAKNNIIDINFNKWFVDIDYRKNVAERVGIKFTDRGLDFVSDIGKSSFEIQEKDGRKLKVLERYKIKGMVDMDQLSEETVMLSNTYFGKIIN
jgi:hypothetical protein